MIAATGLRWILTLAFAALAAYGTWRAVRAPRVTGRVPHLLHVVMAVAMAVMAWPRGMEAPAGPQIAFFAAATLWYPAAALLGRDRTSSRVRELAHAFPHAAAMAGMAWMLFAMDRAMDGMDGMGGAHGTAAAGGGGHTGAHHHGGGADSLATMSLTEPGARLAAGLLAAFFLACALWWLARGFDHARAVTDHARTVTAPGRPADDAHQAYDLICHGAMALGMAVMFVLMA